MILSLDEIKKRIIQENDLQNCGSFSTDKQKNVQDTMNILAQLMKKYPERFYRIIRKEELFLNTCLQTFGFHNYIVSLNPDKLFG